MKKKTIKMIIFTITIIMAFSIFNKVEAVNTTTNNSIKSTSIARTGNANLSNLGTKKYDFTGFSPSETEYDITIPETMTEVEVYATTQDSKATYVVSGDKNLKIGTNKVTITVTASDGVTKKEYYINVRRLGDPSKNPVEEPAKSTVEQTQTTEKKDQSDITRYSEPHTEYGWYIIGTALIIVTILLIIFIKIDDYKKPEKKPKRGKQEIEKFDEEEKQDDEEQYNKENYDSQATKVLKLDEIKNMKGQLDNKKGKHF